MKKLFITAAFIILIAPLTPLLAPHKCYAQTAQVVWARALNQTTYLYNSADESSPCFLIPETYYVHILSEEGDYYLASYGEGALKSIYGYVKKSQLYLCDYVPENPFLQYKLPIYDGAKGYKNASDTAHDYIFNSGNSLYYYGKLNLGGTLYYYASAFGEYRYYIKASECRALEYALNADPLPLPEGGTNTDTDTPKQPEPTDKEPSEKMSEKLKVALILILVIPALTATAFLFKPAKKPAAEKKDYFYDEADYE